MQYNSIDLFSGCGGLTLGLGQSGINSVLAIDNWSDALETLGGNLPSVETRLLDLGGAHAVNFGKSYRGVDFVVGGPPCQGFSISGKRNPLDPRNRLYEGFLKVVKDAKPRMFLMENVPNLASMEGGQLLKAIISDFENLGYLVSHQIVLASEYGVPQNRRRLILVGTRERKRFEFVKHLDSLKVTAITSRDAIGDLPEDTLLDGSPYPCNPLSAFQEEIRLGSSTVNNHEITNHAEKTISTIHLVPDGGNYKDLPEHLRDTRRVNIAWTRINSSKPSMTIDTGHRHHFHYSYDRVPTVRESARLQSFPDTFIFRGSKTSQYKQVGNAVPPLLANAIGCALISFLEKP
ncbi:MAG: DNA cytosine methyltransferase [Armatimonadota bacterium]